MLATSTLDATLIGGALAFVAAIAAVLVSGRLDRTERKRERDHQRALQERQFEWSLAVELLDEVAALDLALEEPPTLVVDETHVLHDVYVTSVPAPNREISAHVERIVGRAAALGLEDLATTAHFGWLEWLMAVEEARQAEGEAEAVSAVDAALRSFKNSRNQMKNEARDTVIRLTGGELLSEVPDDEGDA